MNKLFLKIKNFLKSSGRHFIYFFLVFTGIFLMLTGATVGTLTRTIYGKTDLQLTDLSKKPAIAASLGWSPAYRPTLGAGETTVQSPADENGQYQQTLAKNLYNPNTFIVLYDASGNVLNYQADGIATYYHAQKTAVDKSLIGKIGAVTLNYQGNLATSNDPSQNDQTSTNGNMVFRSTLIEANGLTGQSKSVRYIQLFQNVTQLQENFQDTQLTIYKIMALFWILSVGVAIFLSRWSMRPLEAALERQKAFVSNASHELRTPLAILQNRLQLLFQTPSATIIDASENISASLNEVRNMRLLTNNLLEMAKSDGKISVKKEDVGRAFFEETFANYELLARDQAKEFSSSISFDKPDEKLSIDGDLVKQVLTIFFDNAVKYTGADGKISISVEKSGHELILVSSDNGPGISDDNKKKIFDRFYRVDEARTRGKNGLGLGLSLAREIVSAMKGTIAVKDNQPTGTRFIIKLKV
ncbi:MAG: HAMP domain-containing histidine kinase [Streptococcaceae bacterium]|nr:HAMP domain-containing histidine kinase [Streptococcaceae bacterium]